MSDQLEIVERRLRQGGEGAPDVLGAVFSDGVAYAWTARRGSGLALLEDEEAFDAAARDFRARAEKAESAVHSDAWAAP